MRKEFSKETHEIDLLLSLLTTIAKFDKFCELQVLNKRNPLFRALQILHTSGKKILMVFDSAKPERFDHQK